MNQGFQKLTYFTHLIWIDQNPQIQQELKKFIFAFGDQLFFSTSPSQALQLIHTAQQEKFLIISSSKIIQQIQVHFSPCFNCYPKFIFFCGSIGRCDYITKKYPEIVYRAEYHQDKIFTAIFQLQKNLQILIKNSLTNPIWVVNQQSDKQEVKKYQGGLLKDMQYIQYMPVKILDKQKIKQEQSFPNNKHVVLILDNRQQDNGWIQNFREVQQLIKEKNVIRKVFMIIDEHQRKNEKDNQQFQQFLSQCEKVSSTKELYQSIVNFNQQLKAI